VAAIVLQAAVAGQDGPVSRPTVMIAPALAHSMIVAASGANTGQ
jgi:hypothetical protein